MRADPRLLRLLVLAGSFVWVGCAPTTGEQEVEVGDTTTISVSNDRGSVSLIGGVVPDLVFLSYQIFSDDGRAGLDDVSLVAGPTGPDFVVSVSTPGPDVWVDLVVGMPAEMSWLVTTGSGDIFLEFLEGGGEVQTSSGMVSGGDIRGGVTVGADSSDVHFEMEVGEGDEVSVQLGQGSVELDLPSPTHAQLEASTDDGVLSIWDLVFDGDIDSRFANGVLGNGGTATIFLHTGLGDISLIGAGESAE